MAFKAMRSVGCDRCDLTRDAGLIDWSPTDDYGRCPCGGTLRFVPEGFMTDVFGSAQYSDAVGDYVTSSHDRDRKMRDAHHEIGDSGFSVKGYEPCGDKVHGARPDHSLKNTAFSGGGIGARTSTGERSLHRDRVRRA